MRDVPERLQNSLSGGATTLCRCWLLSRRDGVRMGFTDHDREIGFDGVVFEPRSGLTAGAVERSTGLSVDTADTIGALSSAGLREEDVTAGRLDGAEVTLWVVDWRNTEDRVLQFRGQIGEVTRSAGVFEAELRSRADLLNKPIGRAILRRCDAALGDARCKVDLDRPEFLGAGAVTDVTSEGRITVAGLDGFDPGWFDRGRIVWLSGANAGLESQVKRDVVLGGRVIEIWALPAFSIAVGDGFEIRAGCDKSGRECRQKFSNFINYRGFPHVPGEDWIMSYPKTGELLDGGRLRG